MSTDAATPSSDSYEVVVIGGGAAGLSAALTLGRSRRSVLVIDGGDPRNARADGVHNFLTRDGIAPAELVAAGRAEVASYGGEIVVDRVVETASIGDGAWPRFSVTTAGGHTVEADRLILATGTTDLLPDIPGIAERFGHDVIHCPYCHGWEVRDQAVGILGTGPFTVHGASLFRQLTSNLTVFMHTAPALTDEQAEQLSARGVTVVEGTVASLEIGAAPSGGGGDGEDGAGQRLTGVRLTDGTVVPIDALAIATTLEPRTVGLEGLGLNVVDHPMGMGRLIEADPMGATNVPGVRVAGNVTDPMLQVVGAANAGVMAGAMTNGDLIAQDTALAVAAVRS